MRSSAIVGVAVVVVTLAAGAGALAQQEAQPVPAAEQRPAGAQAASAAEPVPAGPQPGGGAEAPASVQTAPVAPPAVEGQPGGPGRPGRYLPNRFAGRAGHHYKLVWGVDSLNVKLAESGLVIRFSWRVLDPDKAMVLHDKRIEPMLVAPEVGVSLVVPTFEKIGQMRQSAPPEVGKTYWMAFSNKGRLVKRGDRVNVVIGTFRAEGLVVD